MATGYTFKIGDDCTFEEFVMNCSRAMGALVMMRDEPMGAKIPHFKPSTYHKDALSKIKRKMTRLKKMTVEEALDASAKQSAREHRAKLRRCAEDRKGNAVLLNKYEAMLEKVRAWTPPTPDHEGFRDFMIEQIEKSIDFDCPENYRCEGHEQASPTDYFCANLKSLTRDLDYHQKEWDKEVKRTNDRNQWIRDLVDSLDISYEEAGLEVKKEEPKAPPKKPINRKKKLGKKSSKK